MKDLKTDKPKNNAGKVMIMAKDHFDIELKPSQAQKIVNMWVEEGIEITLKLAKLPPRNLIAYTWWIFPRIKWGLNALNISDKQYDDYKRAGREDDRKSEGRDEMVHYRDEEGKVDWEKIHKEVTPIGEILKKVKPPNGGKDEKS